jgi:hypothetical protein
MGESCQWLLDMFYCLVGGKMERYNIETWDSYVDLISENCVKQVSHVIGSLGLTPYNLP